MPETREEQAGIFITFTIKPGLQGLYVYLYIWADKIFQELSNTASLFLLGGKASAVAAECCSWSGMLALLFMAVIYGKGEI